MLQANKTNNLTTDIFSKDRKFDLPLTFEVEKSSAKKPRLIREKEEEETDSEFEFATNIKGPYVMEQDLDFRQMVMEQQHRRMFEIQETLDHSGVDDLISYKLKGDK